jgi:hypothetical protein
MTRGHRGSLLLRCGELSSQLRAGLSRRTPRSPTTGRQGRRPALPRGHRRAAPQHATRPRPPERSTGERDGPQRARGPSTPTAHSRQFRGWCPVSGLQPLVRLPTPFCLASAPGPLAADRRSIVRGRSRPPPHLRHQAAPQLLPAVTAAEGGPFHTHPVVWRLVAQDRNGRPAEAHPRSAACRR